MCKYAIESIVTELLDRSTYSERNYVSGDSEIILRKWEVKQSSKYFEESRAVVKLSDLPQEIQKPYSRFERALIKHLTQSQ